MKIVHFAWSGDAARRRQALRDALGRIPELVRETKADALFCDCRNPANACGNSTVRETDLPPMRAGQA